LCKLKKKLTRFDGFCIRVGPDILLRVCTAKEAIEAPNILGPVSSSTAKDWTLVKFHEGVDETFSMVRATIANVRGSMHLKLIAQTDAENAAVESMSQVVVKKESRLRVFIDGVNVSMFTALDGHGVGHCAVRSVKTVVVRRLISDPGSPAALCGLGDEVCAFVFVVFAPACLAAYERHTRACTPTNFLLFWL